MLYSLISFVIDTIAGLLAGVLLLRFWIQAVRVRPPAQIAQFVFQLSDWLVKPLRRVILGVGGLDWASLIGAVLVAFVGSAIKFAVFGNFAVVSMLLLAVYSVVQWAIYGWTALLILEVIFSWVNPHAPLAPFVQALNAPLLRPIRKIIPPLGGIDLSPMVLFLLLQLASRLLSYLAISAGLAFL